MTGLTQTISSPHGGDDAPLIAKLGFKTYGFKTYGFYDPATSAARSTRRSKQPRRRPAPPAGRSSSSNSSTLSIASTEPGDNAQHGRSASLATAGTEPDLAPLADQPSLSKTPSPEEPGRDEAQPLAWPAHLSYDKMGIERQASQLTSFLSRVKYLHDETETPEAIPLALPGPGAATAAPTSYMDQRALIKAQAVRIRNQLDMKFSAVAFGAQLDQMKDQFSVGASRPHYNPLRTIRDRSDPRIAPHLPKPAPKASMWHISVAELAQDLRWWFNHERALAHKLRQKQAADQQHDQRRRRAHRRRSSGYASTDDVPLPNYPSPSHDPSSSDAGVDSPYGVGPASPQRPASHIDPLDRHPDTTLTPDNFVEDPTEATELKDQFTASLPQSTCTELISRLRSSHDESEIALLDDEGHDGPPVAKFTTRSGSTNSMAIADSDSASALTACPLQADDVAWARRRFCRNSASVADTWNRLYKARQNSSTSEFPAGSPGKGLKPPSISSMGSSSAMSRRSSYSSDVGDSRPAPGPPPDMMAIAASKAAPGPPSRGTVTGMHSDSSGSSVEVFGGKKPDAPVLTLTSESGGEIVLDDPRARRPSATPMPGSLSPAAANLPPQTAPGAAAGDLWLGQEFGSLSTEAVRRDPQERKCSAIDAELRYLVAYYTTALQRPGPRDVLKTTSHQLEGPGPSFPVTRLSDSLKNDTVTGFLKYLGRVEKTLVCQQQDLDAHVATSLDGLRVATDLMVSEVNTTLNRRIREVGSRMERLCVSRGGCAFYTTTLYSFIEYTVLFLMWAIWGFVKLIRIVISPVRGLRYICDNFVVA